MNKAQSTLMDFILASINEGYTNYAVDKSTNLELLYEEAMAHQVHTLIYPVLLKYSKETNLYKSFVENKKMEFLKDIAIQEAHAEQMNRVLGEFHTRNIPVIILKGLVLRDYYPDPSLRLMGDGDILVKKQDVEASKILLQSLGYKSGKSTLRHIEFHYNGYPEIELHTILSDSEIDTVGETFTDTVWDNAILTTYLNTSTLKLSIYDQLIHLLLHASQHMSAGGFGLRQLCDIVLFLQVHMEDIDLDTILNITRKYHIHRFSLALFAVCQKLFCLNLSGLNLHELEEDFIDLFIQDIFTAGVFGRKTNERASSNKLVKYMDTKNTEGKFTKVRYFFSFFFPSHNIIKRNYHYVINQPYLLPITWFHRILRNTGNLFTFKLDHSLKHLQESRFKLLLWLQLR
jgi:hypothetical protein